jgi:hypothetical protein
VAYARDFLLAILIDGLGQHMSSVKYRTILRYRLIISLFSIDEVCHVCRKVCLGYTLLECMSFIVRSFPALSTSMTLLGMYFLIYSDRGGATRGLG